jgi:meiotically up-regulated gene 157 (Mug157) protein
MARPESAPKYSAKKRAPRAIAAALLLGAIPAALTPTEAQHHTSAIQHSQELKLFPFALNGTIFENTKKEPLPPVPKYERPTPEKRTFTSEAVEKKLQSVVNDIGNKDLAHMFINTWPNTLDTTVKDAQNGFIITGDINSMWLRDSSAQLLSYISVVDKDPKLQNLYKATIGHQAKDIINDPYAENFYEKNQPGDRRWEVDSLCWFLRLSDSYYEKTGDKSIFTPEWKKAADTVVQTFKTEQRKNGKSDYEHNFAGDPTNGRGTPTNNETGMIHSAYRPSDWSTTYQFLIPSNIMATIELDKLAIIYKDFYNDQQKAKETQALSNEVKRGVEKYGTYDHPKYGKIYAYEVDGNGKFLLSDDANVPSLLALPLLDKKFADDPIYKNTRNYVLSSDNSDPTRKQPGRDHSPGFVQGTLGKGLGSYNGPDQFWPMSLCTQILTSHDKNEIKEALDILKRSTSGTHFMHESVQKNGENGVIDDGFNGSGSRNYTRSWFAWANGYFGETIMYIHDKYPDLLK